MSRFGNVGGDFVPAKRNESFWKWINWDAYPGNSPPSPGLAPWAILICKSSECAK